MSETGFATAPLVRSQAQGATDVPLIEQTIGAFFDAMVARQPGHEALVSVHQGRRYTTAGCNKPRTSWPAPCCARVCSRATGWASGRTTTSSGC